MNRLQSPSFPNHSTSAADSAWCGGGVFHATADDATHALFAPLHYEPNYAYPLLVWLHGSGDSERQLRRIMPLVSLRNYVAVAPRGTQDLSSRNARIPSGPRLSLGAIAEHVAQAEQRIRQAVAEAQHRFHIRPDRIFLAGYECGGTMAFRVAAEQAAQFAGVVSLCGPFPTEGTPLANSTSCDNCRCSLPLAARDTTIPPSRCATTCGCSIRRECRSRCANIRAKMD